MEAEDAIRPLDAKDLPPGLAALAGLTLEEIRGMTSVELVEHGADPVFVAQLQAAAGDILRKVGDSIEQVQQEGYRDRFGGGGLEGEA